MSLLLYHCYAGESEQESAIYGEEATIGRCAPEHTVDLDLSPDRGVSRLHARLFYDLGTWYVEDLGSTHGTFLNGERVRGRGELWPGDRLRLGKTEVRVEFEADEFETVGLDPESGRLSSQFPVDETELPGTVSEDERLAIFERVSQVPTFARGQQLVDAFLREVALALPHAERYAITLVEGRELVARGARPAGASSVSFTLARRALTEREAFRWDLDVAESRRIRSLRGVTSALYAPMLCGGDVIGVVSVDTTSTEAAFRDEELHLLSVLANIMGASAALMRSAAAGGADRLPNVFVSYVPDDRALADRLARDLRRRSVKVWFDERVQPGENRKRRVAGAIREADAFLILVPPNGGAFPDVHHELDLAMRRGLPVIPLVCGAAPLPDRLREVEPVRVGGDDHEAQLDALAVHLTSLPLRTPTSEEESPMQILFLAANPVNGTQLRLDQEVREIDQRLQAAEFRDRFDLHQQWAVRPSDLSQALLRHRPHIVHFAGHGSEQGALYLEDEQGHGHAVAADVLARLFRVVRDNIRCVVLNACWSAEQAAAVAEVVDCVVGMTQAIDDSDAIRFASGFYQGLGFGRNVKESFELGCLEIDLANLPGGATPHLLTRTGIDAEDVSFVDY